MSDIYDQLSKLVRENNVNKIKEKLSSYKEEGRPLLFKFNYSLEPFCSFNWKSNLIYSESITKSNIDFPRTSLHILHVAAYYDSLETFLFVYNFGISTNVKSPNDYYPLHYACFGGAFEVVSFLCSPEIINVEELNFAPNNSNFSPIFLATLSKSKQILELLFDSGASIPPHNTSPIKQAILCKDYDCLSFLLSHAYTDKVDEKFYTPVMRAISLGFPEAVKILVEHGANIYYQTPDGKSAFSLACSLKNENLVKFLLDNGFNTMNKGFLGQYPIHWAAQSDNVNIVKMVIANGGDPNVIDNYGRPPTFSALLSPNHKDQILKILLDAGCNPNAVYRRAGNTILGNLILLKADPVVLKSIENVLNAGGDLNFVGKNKKTLYQMVQIVSNPEIKKLVNDFLQKHPEIKVK